jgi:hypothetical protein
MDKFDDIYINRVWGFADNETLSGGGSTKSANLFRNQFLANFINEKDIHLIYDICGDCNWQNEFMKMINVKDPQYFGFDVSKYALDLAKEKNKQNSLMTFAEEPINLCETILKCSDNEKSLIIIKEVIQHLPLKQGIRMLQNIKKSGIKYIAITNHDKKLFNVASNVDVEIGGFYPNNMFLHPFNFTNPLKDINDRIFGDSLKISRGNLIIFNIQEQNI